jgi:predicted dehydrogenase
MSTTGNVALARHDGGMGRRGFLGGMLAAGAAPVVVPASVLGRNAPSNKIALGVVGLGSRAGGDVPAFLGNPRIRLVAMADCNRRRLLSGWAPDLVARAYGRNHGVRSVDDFREVCTAPDVDAVAVIANLHWHPYITLLAVKNGKHVFMEKPYAPSVEEGRLIVEAVKKKGVVFQVGFQRRCDLNFRWAAELALNGELGEVKEVICSTVGNRHWDHMPEQPVPKWMDWKRWCGPCEITPFNEKKLSIWPTEFISQYSPNGMMQCWGCHYLDLAQFGLRREHQMPSEVSGFGTFLYPGSSLTDTVVAWNVDFVYDDGLRMKFVDNATNRYGLEHGIRFVGTKGWAQGEDRGFRTSIPDIAKTALKPGKMPIALPHCRGGVIADFVSTIAEGRRECVMTQVENGWRSDAISQLAMHSIKRGRRLAFDAKAVRYTNDEEANRLLRVRPYRNGWNLDDVRV